jgi:hypothetical protein
MSLRKPKNADKNADKDIETRHPRKGALRDVTRDDSQRAAATQGRFPRAPANSERRQPTNKLPEPKKISHGCSCGMVRSLAVRSLPPRRRYAGPGSTGSIASDDCQ